MHACGNEPVETMAAQMMKRLHRVLTTEFILVFADVRKNDLEQTNRAKIFKAIERKWPNTSGNVIAIGK